MSKLYPVYSPRGDLARKHPTDKSALQEAYARDLAGGSLTIVKCPPETPSDICTFIQQRDSLNTVRSWRRGKR
jgi:hypothetical protein